MVSAAKAGISLDFEFCRVTRVSDNSLFILLWREGDDNLKIYRSFLSGNGSDLLVRRGGHRRVSDRFLGVLAINGDIGYVGLRGDLLQDVLVILPSHQLAHEFVGTLDDLVDLLYLPLLQLLVAHSLVLAILLDRAAQGAAQRAIVGLFDRRLIEGKRKRLERVYAGEDVDVFIAHCHLLFLLLLLDRLIERTQLQIRQQLLLIIQIAQQLRESLLIALQKHAKGEDEPAAESINQPVEQIGQILLKKQLAVLLKGGGLEQDLPEGDPIIILANFFPALIEIVYIVTGFHQPIPYLHLFLFSHHDIAS